MKVQQGWLPPHEAEELQAKLAAAEAQVKEQADVLAWIQGYDPGVFKMAWRFVTDRKQEP